MFVEIFISNKKCLKIIFKTFYNSGQQEENYNVHDKVNKLI